MPEILQILDFAVRLLLAALFAAVLGWEREARHKPAGLRTHMLVALGAASVALVLRNINKCAIAGGDLTRIQGARKAPIGNRQLTSNAEDGSKRPSPSGRGGTGLLALLLLGPIFPICSIVAPRHQTAPIGYPARDDSALIYVTKH
ncbi:MAG: MgtC/SapB family protein [Acidobacteriota bacterium]